MLDELLNGLGVASDVLDTPGRFLRTAISGGDALGSILDPSKGKSFGLIGDTILDPTNLIGAGAAAKLFRMLGKVKTANKASMAARAAGHMPEEIAKLTKIVDETGKPLRTYHGTGIPFDSYDLKKAKPDIFGRTIWTSTDPRVANGYAQNAVQIPVTTSERVLINDARANAANAARMKMLGEQQSFRHINHLVGRGEMPESLGRAIRGSMEAELIRNEPRARRLFDIEQRANKRAMEANNFVPSRNVRMQFIDARNPLDMRKDFSVFDKVRSAADTPGSTYTDMSEATNRALRDLGYDAVIDPDSERAIIAFDPSQIYKPYIAPALQREPRGLMPLLGGLAAYNAMLAPTRGD